MSSNYVAQLLLGTAVSVCALHQHHLVAVLAHQGAMHQLAMSLSEWDISKSSNIWSTALGSGSLVPGGRPAHSLCLSILSSIFQLSYRP